MRQRNQELKQSAPSGALRSFLRGVALDLRNTGVQLGTAATLAATGLILFATQVPGPGATSGDCGYDGGPQCVAHWWYAGTKISVGMMCAGAALAAGVGIAKWVQYEIAKGGKDLARERENQLN